MIGYEARRGTCPQQHEDSKFAKTRIQAGLTAFVLYSICVCALAFARVVVLCEASMVLSIRKSQGDCFL